MKASSAIPFVCKPYVIGGIPYYDGALGDTIPIDLALDCDKIVLILTKPRHVLRTSGKDSFFAKRIEKQYPRAAECLRTRAERYNAGVTKAIELEKAGKKIYLFATSGGSEMNKTAERLLPFMKNAAIAGTSSSHTLEITLIPPKITIAVILEYPPK